MEAEGDWRSLTKKKTILLLQLEGKNKEKRGKVINSGGSASGGGNPWYTSTKVVLIIFEETYEERDFSPIKVQGIEREAREKKKKKGV